VKHKQGKTLQILCSLMVFVCVFHYLRVAFWSGISAFIAASWRLQTSQCCLSIKGL